MGYASTYLHTICVAGRGIRHEGQGWMGGLVKGILNLTAAFGVVPEYRCHGGG